MLNHFHKLYLSDLGAVDNAYNTRAFVSLSDYYSIQVMVVFLLYVSSSAFQWQVVE